MAKKLCICNCLKWSLFMIRIFGLLPISWQHKNDKCVFKTSRFWVVYTVVLAVMNVVHLVEIYQKIGAPFRQDWDQILTYIAALNENVLSFFILILICINLYRAPKIAKVYNSFVDICSEDLLCQSAFYTYRVTHIIFCTVMFCQYVIQYGAFYIFQNIDYFELNISYDKFLMPLIHNTSFLFYSVFGSSCTLAITMLSCFETKINNTLKYKPAHPMKNFIVSKITYPFFYTSNVCKTTHATFGYVLKPVERVEYLQMLFNRLQKILMEFNESLNPQLLLHMTNELIVMVFHWYAVIIFFTLKNNSPTDNTNNFFHWYYIFVHTWALLCVMSLSQQVECKIARFKCIMLEYSTHISRPEEYQIIRAFVDQLNNHRGFSASGIFSYNLQIVAPICANILMYVLVAIQFKFPKGEEFINATTQSNLAIF